MAVGEEGLGNLRGVAGAEAATYTPLKRRLKRGPRNVLGLSFALAASAISTSQPCSSSWSRTKRAPVID